MRSTSTQPLVGQFAATMAGRKITFTQSEGGAWSHDAWGVAAVLGDVRERATWERAEEIRWALNSGLASPDVAVHLNRRLAALEGARRRGRGGRPIVLFRAKPEDPICLPLSLYRGGHVDAFGWGPSLAGPGLAEVDHDLTLDSLANALTACGPRKNLLERSARDPFVVLLAVSEGALLAHKIIRKVSDTAGASVLERAVADMSWIPKGVLPFFDWAFSERVGQDGPNTALAARGFVESLHHWMWTESAAHGVLEQMAPRYQWLYACLFAYATEIKRADGAVVGLSDQMERVRQSTADAVPPSLRVELDWSAEEHDDRKPMLH